jgi:hypothetical protein
LKLLEHCIALGLGYRCLEIDDFEQSAVVDEHGDVFQNECEMLHVVAFRDNRLDDIDQSQFDEKVQ